MENEQRKELAQAAPLHEVLLDMIVEKLPSANVAQPDHAALAATDANDDDNEPVALSIEPLTPASRASKPL